MLCFNYVIQQQREYCCSMWYPYIHLGWLFWQYLVLRQWVTYVLTPIFVTLNADVFVI